MQDSGTEFCIRFWISYPFVESRYVASGSMLPNLEVNDRLVIDNLSYGWSNPERGDIIVFYPTQKLKQQNVRDTLTKRVIGLPGEKVEIEQ